MRVINDLLRGSGSESCGAAAVCVKELTGAEQPSSTRLSLRRWQAIVCISATLTGDERSLFCVYIAGTVMQPECKPQRDVKWGNRRNPLGMLVILMLSGVKTSNAPGQEWSETLALLVIWQSLIISFMGLSESKSLFFFLDSALSPWCVCFICVWTVCPEDCSWCVHM